MYHVQIKDFIKSQQGTTGLAKANVKQTIVG